MTAQAGPARSLLNMDAAPTIAHRPSPRVSIGMPVYNGERFLAQAIEGLLAQTFQDFDLIICDNASSDRTEEICRQYAGRDNRIRYVRNPSNLGASGNYRRTFELSSSEYFKWATYDDLCASEFLARCTEVLDRQPEVVLAYPRTKLIDQNGQVLTEFVDGLNLQSKRPSERLRQLFSSLKLSNPMYGVMRSSVLKRTALIGPYIASDVSFLAELTLYGLFWEIPEFLFFRRFHPAAASSLKNTDDLLKFLAPAAASKKRATFTEWQHHWNYFRAALRAPLGLKERMRVMLFLSRMAVWNRIKLAHEVTESIWHGFHRKTGA